MTYDLTCDLCGVAIRGLHYTSCMTSKFLNRCRKGCNSVLSRCRHILTADGLQEIEDFVGDLCYTASRNEIVKTLFGMFLVLNHKRLQKPMLIAHAMSYAWPSLKYPFTNMVA